MSSVPVSRCDLCERIDRITLHHVWPKSCHKMLLQLKKKGYTREQLLTTTIPLCQKCHVAIHQIFTNSQLALDYYSLELLLTNEKVLAYLSMFWSLDNSQKKCVTIETLLKSVGVSCPYMVNLMDSSSESDAESDIVYNDHHSTINIDSDPNTLPVPNRFDLLVSRDNLDHSIVDLTCSSETMRNSNNIVDLINEDGGGFDSLAADHSDRLSNLNRNGKRTDFSSSTCVNGLNVADNTCRKRRKIGITAAQIIDIDS